MLIAPVQTDVDVAVASIIECNNVENNICNPIVNIFIFSRVASIR